MAIPTRTAQVTFKDLTNSSPAEALREAREENEHLISVLQKLDEEAKSEENNNGEPFVAIITLTVAEFEQVQRSLKADLEINNGIIELAYNQIKDAN